MGLALVIGLGILQGLTEFLPVSSSGHLRLLAVWFGIEDPQTLFDVILHVGTLVPVCIVYRGELLRMTGQLLSWLRAPTPTSLPDLPFARLALLVVLGTIPTGLIGVGLGGIFEELALDVAVVGAALAVNGFILLGLGALQQRRPDDTPGRSITELTIADALIIGTAQGFAVFRGISRSGSTITMGLARGLSREAAAAYSFLLSIPAILGALVLTLARDPVIIGDAWSTYLVGGLAACVSGTIALILLLRLLNRGRLQHFAWYCFALSAAAIAWRFAG